MGVIQRSPQITYSPELVNGKAVYVSSNCLPVKALNHEPAGRSFHAAALKLSGYHEVEDDKSDNQSVSSEDKSQGVFMPSESYSSKRKKKPGAKNGKQQKDHYALLGLAHLGFIATEEQIRKSYRDAALKYHPDKQAALLLAEKTEEARQAKKDEIENHFKSIQEAYEILMDPVKRRVFDSMDEFDDAIPTECAVQDFFKVFCPTFMRNGKWSVNQPVPSLGEENTPIGDVDAFYNFWYSFKSWREFPQDDEHDPEGAEFREEKRWMERQNAKMREKARKEECARIRALVDNAYKRDPRILKRKEDEKAEKKRKKELKHQAKRIQEEEAKRVAEEERLMKEEEAKRAAEAALLQKKQKEREKRLLRKEKARLRALSAPVVSEKLLGITEDEVETICTSLKIEQLKLLCDEAETLEGIERAQLLKDAPNKEFLLKVAENGHFPKSNGSLPNGAVSQTKEKSENSSAQKEKPWGKDEIEMLKKAILKYPKGTSQRWEVVSEFIGTGRSVEEILKATKTVLLQKPDAAKAFDSFVEKRKPAPAIISPLTTRFESEDVPVEEVSVPKTSDGSEDSENIPVSLTNGDIRSTESDTWSTAQEKALVQALKTFPKETNQRWERVAAAVPGKTVNQCKKKFASIKEGFRNKKNAD